MSLRKTESVPLTVLKQIVTEPKSKGPSKAAKVAETVSKVAVIIFGALAVALAIATIAFSVLVTHGAAAFIVLPLIGKVYAGVLAKIAISASLASGALSIASGFAATKLEAANAGK